MLLGLTGSDPLSWVLLVLLFVGGPGSLLYLLLAAEFITDEQRAQLPRFDWVELPWLLAALSVGVLVALSARLYPPLFLARW